MQEPCPGAFLIRGPLAATGNTSQWIKAATSWAVSLVYIWTTIAPRILWNRSSSYRPDTEMTPFGPVSVSNV